MKLPKNWLNILVHIGALYPIYLMWQDWQTVNPIQAMTLTTGTYALVFLVLSLVVTPLQSMFRFRKLRVALTRKPLGLWGFAFVTAHMLIFIGLEYGLFLGGSLSDSLSLIWKDLSNKRYIVVGFASFLLMVPLAITSTKGWQKRLKKNWRKLHKLVYIAIPLGVIHFYWLVKADTTKPILWGIAVALLLIARIPSVKKTLNTPVKWAQTKFA